MATSEKVTLLLAVNPPASTWLKKLLPSMKYPVEVSQNGYAPEKLVNSTIDPWVVGLPFASCTCFLCALARPTVSTTTATKHRDCLILCIRLPPVGFSWFLWPPGRLPGVLGLGLCIVPSVELDFFICPK